MVWSFVYQVCISVEERGEGTLGAGMRLTQGLCSVGRLEAACREFGPEKPLANILKLLEHTQPPCWPRESGPGYVSEALCMWGMIGPASRVQQDAASSDPNLPFEGLGR